MTTVDTTGKLYYAPDMAGDPLKVEKDICEVFPEDTWIALGHKAVELGRTYCDARAPKCGECPLNSFCKKRTGDGK